MLPSRPNGRGDVMMERLYGVLMSDAKEFTRDTHSAVVFRDCNQTHIGTYEARCKRQKPRPERAEIHSFV